MPAGGSSSTRSFAAFEATEQIQELVISRAISDLRIEKETPTMPRFLAARHPDY